jgi:DNA (cytosine-5)-methyltransferase 1
MSTGQANAEIGKDTAPCLNCNHEAPIAVYNESSPGYWMEGAGSLRASQESPAKGPLAVDFRHMDETGDVTGCLQAKGTGGWSLNYMPGVLYNLIVRRLMPVECGRLQGFPDGWGEIKQFNPDTVTPEQLAFWRKVYATHCAIEGKKAQKGILTTAKGTCNWHNKLHTDSAEYKMWGNGMARPNAQFCVKRVFEHLRAQPTYTGTITLGSLFDGSGTMPLCAECETDGKAVWASEVEPYPVAVTRTHLPGMMHLGSVTDIDGGKIPPVDIITFGSPCQDLSIAGKRAGLKHTDNGDDETTRSGLFMEAIRIIKQMRTATGGAFPKIAIWENVPGAFSSNGGSDFETVLNQLIAVCDPTKYVRQRGKWARAADYGIVAYRTFNAQFWGVPQRRVRLYAIADFNTGCAGEILFEPKGVCWNFEKSIPEGKGIARIVENGLAASCGGGGYACTLKIRSGCEGGGKGALIQEEKSATLATNNDQTLFAAFMGGQGADAGSIAYSETTAPTLRAASSGTNQCPDVVQATPLPFANAGETVTRCLAARHDGSPCLDRGENIIVQEQTFCVAGNVVDRNANQHGTGVKADVAFTLNTQDRHAVCVAQIIKEEAEK